MFGPHAHDHWLAIVGAERTRIGVTDRQFEARRLHRRCAGINAHGDVDKIHRGRADEAGDEFVGGLAVDLQGRADLLHPAVAHDHDAVAQRHRLDLVVGDEHRCRRYSRMQPLDLDPHLRAQFCVEVGQRLVEQKYLRVAHDAAAQRNALLLAAGQLFRLSLHQIVQPEHAGRAIDRDLDLGLGCFLVAEAKGEIVVDAHVLVERVVLEHHRDVAVAWRQMVDETVADPDVAAGDVFQACDHAQRRRLAAAGRADQRHELLVGDLEIDVLYGVEQRAIVLVELAE